MEGSSSQCPCSSSTSAETETETSPLEIHPKESVGGREESRDRISELPDSIRSSILILLPLREAARTSLLSKCWRRTWTSHPNLDLVQANVLAGSAKQCPMCRTMPKCTCSSSSSSSSSSKDNEERLALSLKNYVDAIDQILKAYEVKSKVDVFKLCFGLVQDEYAAHLQKWIDRASAFSLQSIEIIIATAADESNYALYTFSASNLEVRNRLKNIHLQRCDMVVPPTFLGFEFLVTLELKYCRITDENLSRLFSKCLCLERAELSNCTDLTRLEVGSVLSKLRFLTVNNCVSLKTIEIDRSAMLSKFEHHGRFGKFSVDGLKNSAVAEVLPKGRNFFMFTNFTCQIQRLLLKFSYTCKPVCALQQVPTMQQLRVLKLDTCTRGEKDMNWVFLLTNKCPFLEELELIASVVEPFWQNWTYKKTENFSKSHHYHLQVVSISQFYDHHECLIDLALDLLIHAVCLRTMIINRESLGRVSRRVCDLLRERAAAGVELVFHRVVNE